MLKSNPVGSATRVVNAGCDWCSETPLVPDIFTIAQPPHVQFNSIFTSHIHRLLKYTIHNVNIKRQDEKMITSILVAPNH